jgi:hypothetical protein
LAVIASIEDGKLEFQDDLKQNLDRADAVAENIKQNIDRFIEQAPIEPPYIRERGLYILSDFEAIAALPLLSRFRSTN